MPTLKWVRLGVNVDHVATIRNARGGDCPDPVLAARHAMKAGAAGITAHLREDRRHIREDDLRSLMELDGVPLNLEIGATDEMLKIALRLRPHAVCLVPERREELTTEGGLDVVKRFDELRPYVIQLLEGGIKVSLFIDPDEDQIWAAKTIGAPVVELHTGAYCEAPAGERREAELARLRTAALIAQETKRECHAGHGLNYETAPAVAALPGVVELNIGHFLIGEAVFVGLQEAVKKMVDLISPPRKEIVAASTLQS